jgi:thymidylate kinase
MKDQTGIIVLDGPDACGKTTLQQAFVEQAGAIPIHLTYPAPNGLSMFEYQTREMVNAIKLSDANLVIVDRHWISEKLYAKVFRDGSPWPLMGQMMHYILLKQAALYILCLPHTIPLTLKRHNENIDQKHPYPDDKFTELLNEYLDFWEERAYNFFFMRYRIEFEGADMRFFISQALERLRTNIRSQYSPALNVNERNISGHLLKAKCLLVGLQLNPKYFHEQFDANYPFYEYGNSSLFLHQTLNKVMKRGKIDPEYFMWTNVYQLDFLTSAHLSPLHEKGLKIITLGKEAEKVVKRINLPYNAIPHPQYIKRFGEGVTDYEKLLWEATEHVFY